MKCLPPISASRKSPDSNRPAPCECNFGWRMALAGAIAALAIAVPMDPASAQEQPAAKDTIFARKILMGAIDMNMDEVETMLAPEGKLVLSDAQEHAETISTMLMAFPHLFPPATNQWKPGRRARPRDRYVCLSRSVVEFCGFLPACHRGLEDRLERQPRQAGRRIQAADRTVARALQRLSCAEHEDETDDCGRECRPVSLLCLRFCIRRGRGGARSEIIQHEEANGGGQIALLAVAVDLAHQFGQGHVPKTRNLLHAVPECLFEADAGLVTRDHDRPLHDRRFHDASSPSMRC